MTAPGAIQVSLTGRTLSIESAKGSLSGSVNRLGRAFQRLGLKRVMHDVTPDLGVYLTATAAGKSQDGLGALAASDTASAAETAASGQRRQ